VGRKVLLGLLGEPVGIVIEAGHR